MAIVYRMVMKLRPAARRYLFDVLDQRLKPLYFVRRLPLGEPPRGQWRAYFTSPDRRHGFEYRYLDLAKSGVRVVRGKGQRRRVAR